MSKKSLEIITDILSAGFDIRPTHHKRNGFEILSGGKWWGMYNRNERIFVMPLIRAHLRDAGYTESEIGSARDAMLVYAHYGGT